MRFYNYLLEKSMSFEEALNIFNISSEQAKDKEFLNKQWKRLALKNHPDRGGSPEMMQRINVAYDILKGKTKQGAKSDSEKQRDFEKTKQEWDEMRKKRVKFNKKIFDILNDKFDPEVFVNYFNKVTGKKFDYVINWSNIDKDVSFVGAKVQFDSDDMEASIILNFSVYAIHIEDEQVENKDFQITIERYIFKDTKKHKIGKKNYENFSLDVLNNPSVLFTTKKLKSIFEGGAKKTSFKKKDMLTFLEKTLNADITTSGSEVTAHIPVGDEYTLIVNRITMMRQGTWVINGIYDKRRRIAQPPTASIYEEQEATDFFREVQKQMKMSSNPDTKKAVLDRLIGQYKKKKGM